MGFARLCRELDRRHQRLPVQPQHLAQQGSQTVQLRRHTAAQYLCSLARWLAACGGCSRAAESCCIGKRLPVGSAGTRPLPRIQAKPGRGPACQAWLVPSSAGSLAFAEQRWGSCAVWAALVEVRKQETASKGKQCRQHEHTLVAHPCCSAGHGHAAEAASSVEVPNRVQLCGGRPRSQLEISRRAPPRAFVPYHSSALYAASSAPAGTESQRQGAWERRACFAFLRVRVAV